MSISKPFGEILLVEAVVLRCCCCVIGPFSTRTKLSVDKVGLGIPPGAFEKEAEDGSERGQSMFRRIIDVGWNPREEHHVVGYMPVIYIV